MVKILRNICMGYQTITLWTCGGPLPPCSCSEWICFCGVLSIDCPYVLILQNLFGIHPENGSIFVASELDRETVEVVVLKVFVEDLNAEEPPVQNNTGQCLTAANKHLQGN